MPILKKSAHPISPIERAQKLAEETRALIAETEHAIQQTRAVIRRTREANAAFVSLADIIDNIGASEDPEPLKFERP